MPTNPIPLIDDEARLAELEDGLKLIGSELLVLHGDNGWKLVAAADDVRQALAAVRALREVREEAASWMPWCPDSDTPRDDPKWGFHACMCEYLARWQDSIITIINRHTGGGTVSPALDAAVDWVQDLGGKS